MAKKKDQKNDVISKENSEGEDFCPDEEVMKSVVEPDLLYLKPTGGYGKDDKICFSGIGKKLRGKKGFLLKSGSKINADVCKSVFPDARRLREECLKNGLVKDWIVTKDIRFKSADLAADFVLGFRRNSQWPWKNIFGNSVNV